MLGIPPTIVMKWTGHSDYRAMEPYIDVIDESAKKAMAAFDKTPNNAPGNVGADLGAEK